MTSPADSWPQQPIPAYLLRRRRSSSSSLLTLPVVFVLFTIPVVLLLLFLAFHRLFPMSNQFWKSSVGLRRGWDSLNIALVLFAVLCGIFAPRRGDEAAAEEAGSVGGNEASPKVEKAVKVEKAIEVEKAIQMSAQQWFQSIDRRIYDLPEERVVVAGIGRVGRKGGSSLLDPMQESWLGMGEGRFPSLDELAVDGYYRRFDRPAHVPLRRWQSAIDESEIKEIQMDTFVRDSKSPPPEVLPETAKPKPPPNPPPPPPPPSATKNKRPGYDSDAVGATATPPPPPPPPRREQSPERIERRKSSAKAELKEIIASVLSANKRKKRKPKARTIKESVSVHHGADEMPARRIPPPPPPPQPQSFLSIFKRTTKTRRIHSASAQPPHPPSSPVEHARRSTTKPPLPKKTKNNHEGEKTIHLPEGTPAAPLPPQQSSLPPNRRRRSLESGMAGNHGDASLSPPTEKTRGTSSSDCSGVSGRGHVDGKDASRGGPGLFCESPDVNVKADTFIARLKDGWRMERMNSIKEKHGLSIGLGSDPL